MYAHNGAYVSCEISSTGRDGEIFGRVEPVCVDHEVTVIFVNRWCLASVATVEELGQRFALEAVYLMHVEPSAVTWQNDGVCLRDEVRAGL